MALIAHVERKHAIRIANGNALTDLELYGLRFRAGDDSIKWTTRLRGGFAGLCAGAVAFARRRSRSVNGGDRSARQHFLLRFLSVRRLRPTRDLRPARLPHRSHQP